MYSFGKPRLSANFSKNTSACLGVAPFATFGLANNLGLFQIGMPSFRQMMLNAHHGKDSPGYHLP